MPVPHGPHHLEEPDYPQTLSELGSKRGICAGPLKICLHVRCDFNLNM